MLRLERKMGKVKSKGYRAQEGVDRRKTVTGWKSEAVEKATIRIE